MSRFALYPWFRELGDHLIHSEDVERLAAHIPYGKVFEILGEREDFVLLGYGEQTFRVRPELLRKVSAPRFQIGGKVTTDVGGLATLGEVAEIRWHFKENAPIYFLRINGKSKSKRYWERDLAPA
jgi:hypothetical protein